MSVIIVLLKIFSIALWLFSEIGPTRSHSAYTCSSYDDQCERPATEISDLIFKYIQPESISSYLKELTRVPRLAGTPEDWEQAEFLRDFFVEQGMDHVSMEPIDVLLSFPEKETPNKVYLLDSNGKPIFETSGFQPPVRGPEENSSYVFPNYNAYSGTGVVQGNLVYANYGREEDFKYLLQKGVEVKGNIVIARYGAIFRGNIVKQAEQLGASGVLLYGDPIDYAQEGRDNVYADSVWLTGMAVQTGSVKTYEGDPLTPLYPAVEGAYRIDESDAGLPTIPVQPIGYDEAEVLLRAMKSLEAPKEWKGGLNATYALGPQMIDGQTARMNVKTRNRQTRTYNIIATITGQVEPDRYVLLGNHRDTWSMFGSIDPLSGTASMMELARVFMKIHKETGWRPRRSIVFCVWAAEEPYIIGSLEWVEEHMYSLMNRAVAYINVDLAIQGNQSMQARAVPLLYDSLFDAAKKTPNPNPQEVAAGRATVYDTWYHTFPDKQYQIPRIKGLGSGSDYFGFMHYLGIPSSDHRYTYDNSQPSYPLYHTLYETYYLVSDLYDVGFNYITSVASMWGEMARNLADSKIIPFNVMTYGQYLQDAVKQFKEQHKEAMQEQNIDLVWLEWAAGNFSKVATEFQDGRLPSVDLDNPYEVRRVNDQLMLLERSFIEPRGLPNRPGVRHVVFAPSSKDSYATSSFSGLSDLLHDIKDAQDPQPLWKQFKQHLSAITYLFNCATQQFIENLHSR